jgi:DNA-binding response OmpR family regulator
MKILIVDDERVVLEGCRLVLQSEGYEAILVSSSDFALEIMGKINPSLLLVDLKMPGHDGIYLLEEVKKQWPEVPIIVMSGYATPETIEEVFVQGADAFLPKPFTPDELLEKIRQASNGGNRP